MKPQPAHLSRLLIWLAIVLVLATPSHAQRGRWRNSELDLLRSPEVLQEIGVPSDVIDEIGELQQQNTSVNGGITKFREEIGAAKTDEERTAIREKFRKGIGGGQRFQQQALELLDSEQQKQLRRVFIEKVGVSALADNRIAADLELDQTQRTRISELLKERKSAEWDRNLSDVDRTASLKESDTKIIAVLSQEQRVLWTEQSAGSRTITPGRGDGRNDRDEVPLSVAPSSVPANDVLAGFGEASSEPDRRTDLFSFNFHHAPWKRVLQLFADEADLTLDMQRVPPGTLSHLDHREYTAAQALDILNGYLIRRGFGIVQKDRFLIVVNLDEQLDQSLVPEVTLEQLKRVGDEQIIGDHQLVTVRVPMPGLDTGRTAQEVEALLGPWGSMIALTQSHLLMVTDIGANLRRIMGLLDAAARPGELVFHPYHLRHIDVEDAESLLLTQFGMRQATKNVSAAVERRNSRGGRSRNSESNIPARPAPVEELQVAADVRTNSLLVTGTSSQHALVKTIVEAIDVSKGPDGQTLSRKGRRGRYLMVYRVDSADAREVTKTLDAIMPGIVVNEDGRTGKVHIMATEKEHDEVAQLIRQLDGEGGRQSVAVIPLSTMDPLIAAATLKSLFLSEGTEAPTLETDVYGRRLIVRGDPEQISQIKVVLAQLGEDGSGVRPPRSGGAKRRYSLQGRSSKDFLQILRDTWQDSEPNPIRVIVPSRTGPVRERRTSNGIEDSENDPAQSERSGDERNEESSAENASATNFAAAYLTVGRLSEEAESTEPTADEVLITVLGNDLLLSSNDPEALDRLEDMLDTLQQMLPYRTRWTVFYLQAADAVEAADMLSQLFPDSSVTSTVGSTGGSVLDSLANSVSGIGSSLADATGLRGFTGNPQALRIIPDVRSNSLLITGPDSVLQDVWAMLNVLDSNDIPESFRDMQQRTIDLEHADIDNVAAILREIYRPLMESQGTSRQRQQNPFAAMLGAGSNNVEKTSVQMTLGVDRRTSSLIVSSSQEIFDDVKELVETLDQKALSANRRIRVVQLRGVEPADVQRSLTGLFPRITSSVSSLGTSRTGGNNNSNTGREQRQRETQERQAAEVLRRFRDRAERRRRGAGDAALNNRGRGADNGQANGNRRQRPSGRQRNRQE
ncbi:MAG: hypothetical protein MK102_11390 [Fuerstiella sp.]|nr:hypothetical protein [Fuerstiella sp.]